MQYFLVTCKYPWSLTLMHISMMRQIFSSTDEQGDSRSWMINMSFQKADIKAISMCSPALTDNPFPMVGCEIIQVNEAYQIILLALTWDQMFGFGEQSLVSIFDLIQNVPQNGKVEGCGQISPFITRFLRIKSPSFLQMAVMIMNLIQSRFVTKYKVWKIITTNA